MSDHYGKLLVRSGGLALVCALAAMLAVVVPSAATAADAYEVSGVPVDVTADTAAAARDRALANGHEKAFRRLLERLTLRSEHNRLPDLTPNGIAAYVKDFSVAEEKTSSTRYLAKLDFRFKREDVRRLLMDYGLRFAETFSKPVLVLPVYGEAGALLLWDSPNPWRQAWETLPESAGLVPIVLPLGDLTDIAAIGAEQAANGDEQRLSAVAERYGTDDVMVAQATKEVDTRGGGELLEVSAARYGTPIGEQTLVRSFAPRDGESQQQLLERAAAEIMLEVEDGWKYDNLLRFDDPAIIAATVPITGLQDWLVVRDRLSEVASIRYTDLVLLSRTEVRVNLHYMGGVDQLTLGLAQADLSLMQREDGDWVLRSTRNGS